MIQLYRLTPCNTTQNPSNVKASDTICLYRQRGIIGLRNAEKHLLHTLDDLPNARQIYDHVIAGGEVVTRPASLNLTCIDIDNGTPDGVAILCEIYNVPYQCVRTASGKWHVWVLGGFKDGNRSFHWADVRGEILSTKPITVYRPDHLLRLLDHNPRGWAEGLFNRLRDRQPKQIAKNAVESGYIWGNRHNQLNRDIFYARIQNREIERYTRLALEAGLNHRDVQSCVTSTTAAVARKRERCKGAVRGVWDGRPEGAKVLVGMLMHIPAPDGFCWASQLSIAGSAGVSDRAVRRWWPKLERRGWLRDAGFVDVGKIRPLRKWQVVLQGQGDAPTSFF